MEKYLIHATFATYLPEIMKNGLVANTDHQNWDCEPAVYVIQSDDKEFATNIAMSFCETSEYVPTDVYESGIAVLEIKLDEHNTLETDENFMLNSDKGYYSFKVNGPVKPEQITHLFTIKV